MTPWVQLAYIVQNKMIVLNLYFFQLVSRLLAAGSDPNLANLSGFTALDVSLGAARRTLEAVTTHLTDPALLQVGFVWPFLLLADAL